MLGGAYHASSLESTSPTHASRCSLERVCEKGGNSDGDCQGIHEQAEDSVCQTSGEEEVKPVWDKPRPKSAGKPDPLSKKQKRSAKAMAKSAGRPYPNLVDNMRAAKK